MKTKLLTLFAILSFGASSFAQSVSDDIGSVSCEFAYFTNNEKLEVKKQLLTERAETRTEISRSENESYGSGLAYTEWHLEFVLASNIKSRNKVPDESVWHRGKYCIQLLDKNRLSLVKTYLSAERLRHWQGGTATEPLHTYSLDLIELPLVILDDVAFIDIVLID